MRPSLFYHPQTSTVDQGIIMRGRRIRLCRCLDGHTTGLAVPDDRASYPRQFVGQRDHGRVLCILTISPRSHTPNEARCVGMAALTHGLRRYFLPRLLIATGRGLLVTSAAPSG